MVRFNKAHVALLAGAGLLMLTTATAVNIPKGALAVRPFYVDKFLGKWYEIARMDYKYEKKLDNVTATYTLRKDGDIRVDNRGHDYTKNKWKESIGKAKFVKEGDLGRLKVSFFGPFYAGYNVIAIDREYKYALVAGNNLKYLWILSRETSIPGSVKENYLQKARDIGYDTEALVWCKHDIDV
jgi:apolipoprotein D and lipocalin family protein